MNLTAEGCRSRRQRLWAALERMPGGAPEVLVITDPKHLVWLADFWLDPFVFRSADAAGILLLEKSGQATLVTDNIAAAFAERSPVDRKVAPVWYRSVESAPHRRALVVKSALEELRKLSHLAVGVEMSSVPGGMLEELTEEGLLRVTDLDPVIRPLRRAKDADEMALMRTAVRACEAGHAEAMRGFRPGMSELDAFLMVEAACRRAAGAQVVVYGDFASGPRTAVGGGPPTERVLAAGDLFILDYSVEVRSYRCDFTNTFCVGGTPTARQREVFALCERAMAAGEAKLRAGTACKDVDAAVRGVFTAAGLGKEFRHHTGHGLGLGHPEPPYIVPESSETLAPGDVVTLEPGCYLAGDFGIRIERNYLITDGTGGDAVAGGWAGFELLSRHRIGLEG